MPFCLAQDTITSPQIAWTLAGLAVAVAIALKIRVYRPESVLGPPRAISDYPLWPMLVSAALSTIVWIGIQALYMLPKSVAFAHANPGKAWEEMNLSGRDFAFLATVPGLLAFLVMLMLDRLLDRRTLPAMGFTNARMLPGLAKGFVGILIVFPLLMASAMLLEKFYKLVGYKHPLTHDLLAAMKTEHIFHVKSLLIFGAAIVAPAFEEYLFRGHLQTALARLFVPRSISRTWLAILVTSILFAAVHPAWMAPLIFVLSLCLGYAYERTGNLWVPITIHACFNTLETILFLWWM